MNDRWRTITGYIQIGSLGKVRGTEGELKLFVEESYLQDMLDAGFLFVEVDGNKVPLEIASLREKQDMLVSFVGVDDPGTASRWASSPVYLPSDEVSVENTPGSAESTYHEIEGFTIVDEQYGEVGEILEVREFPQQEMAVIEYSGREVLVPLNPVFIRRIDTNEKRIYTALPEGLLTL